MRRIGVAALAVVLCFPASATLIYRPASNAPEAIWISETAMKEGEAMIAEGLHKTKPELFSGLIACIVESGTRIVVISRDYGRATVRVIDGEDEGCRGVIDSRAVSE